METKDKMKEMMIESIELNGFPKGIIIWYEMIQKIEKEIIEEFLSKDIENYLHLYRSV